jgi:hypothetical protein
MALADSLKNLVVSIRASRSERKAFASGNKRNVKALQEENRNFLAMLRQQSQSRRQETMAFMKSAKEERIENGKATAETIKASLTSVHNGVLAIRQDAHAMMKELREDHALARTYWSMLYTEEALPVDPRSSLNTEKVPKPKKTQAKSKFASTCISCQAELTAKDASCPNCGVKISRK